MATRDRPVSRLEGFSDAVFAFSATLLVVSLDVPATFGELLGDLRGFLAFGLSFGSLVFLWTVHNAFFRRYGLVDRWTVFLNSALLFVVLFYVYPLKFVARGIAWNLFGVAEAQGAIESVEQLGQLFQLYSGGFAAFFLCVALLYRHAWRRREALALDLTEEHEARTLSRHYAIFVFVGALSTLLAWLGLGLTWALPGWAYFLLGPLCWAHGAASERRLARLRTARA